MSAVKMVFFFEKKFLFDFWKKVRIAGLGVLGVVSMGVMQGSGLGPVGFETGEGYVLEDGIDLYPGWSTAGGEISDEESAEGSLSLALFPLQASAGAGWAERMVQPEEWDSEEVVFFTTWILPGSTESEILFGAEIDLDGARVRFYQTTVGTEEVGLIFAVSAEASGEVELDTLFDYPVIDQVGAEEWLRVDIRVDYTAGVWDLHVDGIPLLTELALPSGVSVPTVWTFRGAEDGSSTTFVDEITLSTNNALFVDTNGDGLPDDWEVAYGMNLNQSNRDGDQDGDGISNIQEYFSGTSPFVPNNSTQPEMVFVDAGSGEDGNTGFYPYVSAGLDGPKAGVSAGIHAIQNGMVVVKEGVYEESNLSLQGKQIRLKPIGNVLIN